MIIKIWAYVVATISVLIGIWCLKNKKWSIGRWIICLSLAIFISGNINIGQISPSISNSFNKLGYRMKAVETKVKDLDIRVEQKIALQQQIAQNVTFVTEIKKEIANLNEAIKQIYEYGTREIFAKNDIGKRVMVFKRVGGAGNHTIIYFQLQFIPINNSVVLSNNEGTSSPGTYNVDRNIVIYRINTTPDKILADGEAFYCISYFREPFSGQPLQTVVDMEYKGTPENINAAILKSLKK